MIKAVIFDMDGVIIDNQPFQKQAWKSLFKEYGFEITDEELSQKIRGRPTRVGLKNFFQDKFNDNQIDEIASRKEQLYKEIFEKNFTIVCGFLGFIRELDKSNLKIGLATSSTKELFNFTMSKLKVENLFDAITTSDQIQNSKPHPEMYLKTAKKLRIPPKDCVVFEDSFSGVQSALNAGMKVILVMTTHKEGEFEKVDLAIHDFTEISVSDLIKI